jgi:hypothetical protein
MYYWQINDDNGSIDKYYQHAQFPLLFFLFFFPSPPVVAPLLGASSENPPLVLTSTLLIGLVSMPVSFLASSLNSTLILAPVLAEVSKKRIFLF